MKSIFSFCITGFKLAIKDIIETQFLQQIIVDIIPYNNTSFPVKSNDTDIFHNRGLNDRFNKIHEKSLRLFYNDNRLTFRGPVIISNYNFS